MFSTPAGWASNKNRQVHVAQLDDVEERLLFARVSDGRAVVETVHGNGIGADVLAAGEEEEENGGQRTEGGQKTIEGERPRVGAHGVTRPANP